MPGTACGPQAPPCSRQASRTVPSTVFPPHGLPWRLSCGHPGPSRLHQSRISGPFLGHATRLKSEAGTTRLSHKPSSRGPSPPAPGRQQPSISACPLTRAPYPVPLCPASELGPRRWPHTGKHAAATTNGYLPAHCALSPCEAVSLQTPGQVCCSSLPFTEEEAEPGR